MICKISLAYFLHGQAIVREKRTLETQFKNQFTIPYQFHIISLEELMGDTEPRRLMIVFFLKNVALCKFYDF